MRTILIARVSSKKQETGQSSDDQIHRLRDYIQSKELPLLDTDVFELTESAWKSERKIYGSILNTVRKSSEKIILVADRVDRLYRGYAYVKELEDLVKLGKLEVHVPTEQVFLYNNCDPSNWTLFGMLLVQAKFFSDRTSKRVQQVFAYMDSQGKYHTVAPIGYTWSGEKGHRYLAVNHESTLVVEAFEQYAHGKTIREIARWLGKRRFELGFRTTPHLGKSTVDDMLKNPVYCGHYWTDDILKRNPYDPIISLELFMACQARRRQGYAKKAKMIYRYSGVFHHTCGSIMAPYRATKNGKVYLQCSRSKTCPGFNIPESEVDKKYVLPMLEQLKLGQYLRDDMIADAKQRQIELDRQYHVQFAELQKEKKRIAAEVDEVYQLAKKNLFDEEMIKRDLTRLQKQETMVIDQEKLITPPTDEDITALEEYLEEFDNVAAMFVDQNSDDSDRNGFLQKIIRTAILDKGYIHFTFKKGLEDIQTWSQIKHGATKRPLSEIIDQVLTEIKTVFQT